MNAETHKGRRRPRRRRPLARWLGNLAFVALAGALVLTAVALGLAISHIPAGQAAAVVQPPAGSPTGDGWIPLKSQAPADIIAAARHSPMFTVHRAANGDDQPDLSRLGDPVLVTALQPAHGARQPDFYVIPILDASGAATAAAELQLNPPRNAINVVAILTYAQPHPAGAIARMTSNAALTTVSTRGHVAVRSGAKPQLVYFAGDAAAQAMGTVTWNGGGQSPVDPIWLVPGNDGKDHIAANDGNVYLVSQLPMDPNP